MKLTKKNIGNFIKKSLKDDYDLKSTVVNSDNNCLIKFKISVIEGNVLAEYSDDDDTIELSFFTRNYGSGIQIENIYSTYEKHLNDSEQEHIEQHLEELVGMVKTFNHFFAKVSSKIKQIEEICKQYDMDFDDVLQDYID